MRGRWGGAAAARADGGRARGEALVLEFCSNGDVPFELVEPFLETASEAMLQVIFGRLDVPGNIWDCSSAKPSAMRATASACSRPGVPARGLPLDQPLQSCLGESNPDEVRLQMQQRTTQQQQQQQQEQRLANKLFNTLLDRRVRSTSILNYYLQYEPRKVRSCSLDSCCQAP